MPKSSLWSSSAWCSIENGGRVPELVPVESDAIAGVTREAVTNAVKHAAATEIRVRLAYPSRVCTAVSSSSP